ncbi:M phase inhibitor protein kinase Wee1 [Schizosaccharomyces pombe]|uniref:Mitosis inhibitor protein kinase wee1 n=1 Tax=Schizosaccharomyces pombe (strain 972 / ATCC 24843) TaxID=284812 RepID=WEE1_SCHPO|nr:protein kinase Wee1 [Schizosaccharomyces pombe]P07527.1 RecName: Full=Mitosis inhibitor protein kinase wee1; AltName: Full=P107 protein kinase homolog [Schizosaccharomyces pombe 972h-]AAA35354.1 wee1+ protein [Schizosaccharomyces pombe]CAB52150.1 M phase inhibitor protein kinase Wee1 [Schizosaccharomyces pombe]|eukprot:NP_587933.1 protein kinase Wee1 [Schizosaccharomyces pombe]
MSSSSNTSSHRSYGLRRSQRSMNLNRATLLAPPTPSSLYDANNSTSSTSSQKPNTSFTSLFGPRKQTTSSPSFSHAAPLHPLSPPSFTHSQPQIQAQPVPRRPSLFDRPNLVSRSSSRLGDSPSLSPVAQVANPIHHTAPSPSDVRAFPIHKNASTGVKRSFFSSSMSNGAMSPPSHSPSPFLQSSQHIPPSTPAQKLRKKNNFDSFRISNSHISPFASGSFSPFATSSPNFLSTSTPAPPNSNNANPSTLFSSIPSSRHTTSNHFPSNSAQSSLFSPTARPLTARKLGFASSQTKSAVSNNHSRNSSKDASFMMKSFIPSNRSHPQTQQNESSLFSDNSMVNSSSNSFSLFPNATLPNPPSSELLTTPFQQIKPPSQVFMSTGLLSKQHRPRKNINFTPLPPSTPSKPSTFVRPHSSSTDSPPSPSTPSNTQTDSYFIQRENTPTNHNSIPTIQLEKSSMDFLRFDPPPSAVKTSHNYGLPFLSNQRCPATPTRNPFAFENTVSIHMDGRQPSPIKSRNNNQMSFAMEEEADVSQPSSSSFTLSFPSALTSSKVSSSTSHLLTRFRNVTLLGSGEFSEVFQVEDPVEKTLKYAVKKLKVKFSGPKERNRLLQEVSIQRALKGHDHIVELMDSWEHGGFLYMQVELCENGSLDRFLEEQGQLSRLDEFRVWKILVEVALGLQFIHHKNYVHLDLKPANVMITFEGTLKIGDFGMASVWPVPRGMEREGDCEYIAPEVLANHLYDKPADIFSLGITVFEAAANIVLPDNGQSWQKLRSGDLSDAPRLSSTDNGSSLTSSSRETPANSIIGQGGLDRVVEWMLSPEPRNRPTIDQILATDEVCWVEMRRKAGAIIYEGIHGSSSNPQGDQMMEDWQVNV